MQEPGQNYKMYASGVYIGVWVNGLKEEDFSVSHSELNDVNVLSFLFLLGCADT